MDLPDLNQISRRSFIIGGLGILATIPTMALETNTEPILNDTQSDKFTNISEDFVVSQIKVHFATPYHINNQDAIVIEMIPYVGETKYILIDGGVGPTTGLPHPGYVNRYKAGSAYTNEGFVQSYNYTMAYLRSLGLNKENIVFYMGTHPHLDHMGATAEIISEFKPKIVYTPEYKDEYLIDMNDTYTNPEGQIVSGENLIDSQFLYDRTIEAANKIGSHLITSINSEDDASFSFGGLNFYILNWNSDYKERTGEDRISNPNDMCWGLFIEGCGRKIFLGGDINSYFGSEQYVAAWLKAKYNGDANIDLYKLNHHGYYGSNQESLMKVANPKIIVHTSARTTPFYKLESYEPTMKRGSRMFATTDAGVRNMPAIVVTMDANTLTTNLDGTVTTYGETHIGDIIYQDGRPAKTGWINANNHWYYSNNGKFLKGWQKINNKYWYFTKWGYVQFGWIQSNNTYYYMKNDGNWAASETIEYGNHKYGFDKNGKIIINGWLLSDNGNYYFGSDGKAYKNQWLKYNDAWYYFGTDNERIENNWILYNNNYYYTDSTGKPVTNTWIKYNNKSYYFNASGICTAVK